MSDDRLKIRCRCGQVLTVKQSDAGKVVACPKCSTKLRVPGEANQPAPASLAFDANPESDDLFGDVGLGALPDSQPMANPYAAPAQSRGAAPLNPYAAPAAQSTVPGFATSGDEATRQEYLKHEASLKSIGLLYYLGCFFMLPGGLVALVMGVSQLLSGAPEGGVLVAGGAIYFGIGLLQFFVARGIRRLENWARNTLGALSVLGLLGFPIGTLISAYILYLCFSKAGEFVCSPAYHQVVANTPHITYKTSSAVWILLAIVVVILLVICSGVFLGGV